LLSQPDTLRRRLRDFPQDHPLITDHLWPAQAEAIYNLERSFALDRPRALIQMATGHSPASLPLDLLRLFVCGIIKPMSTKTDLEDALTAAIRSSDEATKRTVRMALTNIRLAEVDKGAPLDESGVQAMLLKEVKSQREAIADAERANRPDLIAPAQQEIAILEGFLPKGMSPEELETLARQAIADAGATSIKEMGQVMKVLMPRLQGRASGDQASQAVRRLLQ
jgi:uncharacterized protein